MWFLQQPDDQQIQAFFRRQQAEPYSYPEVGASSGPMPAGYNIDRNRVALGQGRAVFDAACMALRHWQQYPRTWTEVHPVNPPLAEDQVVVVLAQAFNLWWMNACRIVETIDEKGPVRRFGFAYGTLTGHVETGEERFLIEWDEHDTVWYDVQAFSRPKYWLTRLCAPLVRRLQKRFVRESQQAMRRFIAAALHTAPWVRRGQRAPKKAVAAMR